MKRKLWIFFSMIAVFCVSLTVPAFAICDDCLEAVESFDWSKHCDVGCGCVWESCYSCGDPESALSFYCSNEHDTCPDCGECVNCSECLCEEHECDFYEVSTDEPTCEDTGTIYFKCDCGESYETTIPAAGHNWGQTQTQASTCLIRGYTYQICSTCHDEQILNYLPFGDHDYKLETLVTPTCFVAGYKVEKCSFCGDVVRTDWDPIEHSMNGKEWVAPTCTKGGYYEETCNEGCGYVEITGQTDPLGHDYSPEVTDPTCNEQGYTVYTCTRFGCRDSYTSDYTAATGHVNLTTAVTESTCSVVGVKINTCTDCGEEVSRETLPLASHQFSDGVCKFCSAKDPSYIPPCNHQYSVVSDVPPTCLTPGLKSERCTLCGDIKNTETPKKDHIVTASDVTLPTCTTEGFTRYSCTFGCGYEFISDRKAVLGHDYDILITPSTCENSGYTLYTCKRDNCDASYKDHYTDPTGHLHIVTSEIPASCIKDGLRSLSCSDCGKAISTSVIAALGHNYEDGVCTVCQYSTVCQHEYSERVISPTCADQGYSIFTCSKCGDFYTGNYTNTYSHVWKEVERVEASCEQNGHVKYVCDREGCGVSSVESITALSHSWEPVGTVINDDGTAIVTLECVNCKIQKTQEVSSAAAQAQNWLLTSIRGFSGAIIDIYETVANGVEVGGVTAGEVISGSIIVVALLFVVGFALGNKG